MIDIKNFKFDKVTSGKAKNTAEFFDKLIRPQFENITTIKKIHNSLIAYLSIQSPTFFLRLYGSFSKDKYHLLRRGFLTEYPDGTKMAFCDNTFSMLFAGLKIANIPYNEFELKHYLNQKSIVTSFGQTSKEKELCYYSPQNALKVNLNSKGWYLAHIKPTGYGYDNLDIKSLFPNPPRKEWDLKSKIRSVNNNLEENNQKILKAHFLRLIHPLNSFLVPKRNLTNYSGKNIGEEDELIIYVQNFIQNEFPKEFEEFNEISVNYKFPETTSELKTIEWFDTPKSKNIKNKNIVKNKIENFKKPSKIDVDETGLSVNLDKWLKSIGKEVFLDILYPQITNNMNVLHSEIASKNERYSMFTINSQKSRLSSAKSIFKNGLENEALQIIIDSSNLTIEIREKAMELIEKNGS